MALIGILLKVWVLSISFQASSSAVQTTGLPTVTVRGFLNFKTTVDGTVIVFTPAAELPPTRPTGLIFTSEPSHHNDLESKESLPLDIQDLSYTQLPTLLDPVQSGDYLHIEHKVKEPYLQHITDNAVLPATVQTDNDLETEDIKKDFQPQNHYPTGLVTVLDGTHVQNGKTTVYETKVIGTYIDGKYAQILQSTSKIIMASSSQLTPSYRTVDNTPKVEDTKSVKPTILTSTLSSSSDVFKPEISSDPSSPSPKELATSEVNLEKMTNAVLPDMPKSEKDFTIFNTFLQSSIQTIEGATREFHVEPTLSLESLKTGDFSRNLEVSSRPPEEDNPMVSSKNLRLSSTRTRFTAPRRPSQIVKLNRFKIKLTLRQNSTDGELTTPSDEEELDDDEASKEDEVDVSEKSFDSHILTIDPALVVYHETTITSEVTLHVGRRKSIRTLTITTSVPMTMSPSETDDTSSITVHPTIHDHEAEENAPGTLTVLSRTFTTTEHSQTTSEVPILDGTATSYLTLTESLFIMKIVTAYKTLPPGNIVILSTETESSGTLEEPTILEAAANIQPSIIQPLPKLKTTQVLSSEAIVQASMPLVSGKQNAGLTNPLLSFGHALSNNPLAAVYLGLQQLNAQMTLYSTITQTSTYLTTDTIYSTKTIRFYDGRTTKYRTTSEPVSTKKHIVTTTVTSLQPYINTQAYQQQQQLQKLIVAKQSQPKISTITSIYTTATTATSLSTRIYTLIYNGFSTKFRTVTSTKLYPTIATITSTKEVSLSATSPPLLPFAYPPV